MARRVLRRHPWLRLPGDGDQEVHMKGYHGIKHNLLVGTAFAMGVMGWHGAAAAQATPPADQPAPEAKPQEIVVTGSYLGNIRQENRASPILAVDNAAIARTGSSSIGDLTRFIPQNVGSTGGLQDLSKGGADTRDTRSANLRGLGAGSTLVLLNGRRVTPQAGDDYVNLNSLTPDIAIQRVEVLLDGASSTYGADAVAGVFNVLTDTKFNGFKTSAQFTSIADSPAWNVQAMMGVGNDRFHTVLSASYRFQDNLQNSDRAVTNFFNPTAAGYPGSYLLTGRPLTATGGHVVINGNDYTALYDANKSATGTLKVVDPNCGADGTNSVYSPTGGAAFGLGNCLYNFQPKNPIRPRARSVNIHNDTTFEINDANTLFAELSYYHQDSERFGVPSYAQNAGNATMPASNPYNPFGVDVLFYGRAIGAQGFPGGYEYRVMRDTVNQQHHVLGARGNLVGRWKYLATATYSASQTIARDRDTDMNMFQAALRGYGGPNCNTNFLGGGSGAVPGKGSCLYYSPFQANLSQMDPSLIYNLQSDVFTDFKREYYIAEAVVNGPLASIAGHEINVALGAQYRREKSTTNYSDLLLSGYGGFLGKHLNTAFSREVKSVFAEANYQPIDSLTLNVAGRYEDAGGYSKAVPKVAANWHPVDWFSLRGSYSKAFQAPSLANGSASLIGTNVVNVTDPVDGTTSFRTIQTYGNPNLKPQSSTVYNLGATFVPTRGARFSIDYWKYQFNNQISTQNPQQVVNTAPNGAAVLRDPLTGTLQSVVVTSFNAPSGTKTSGIDIQGQYAFDAGQLHLTLRDTLTYLLAYDVDTGILRRDANGNITGSVVYDGVGYRNAFVQSPTSSSAAPRWRSVAGIDAGYGPHTLSLTWRYTAGVKDDYGQSLNTSGTGAVVPAVTTKVSAFSVFDAQYSLNFGHDYRYALTLGMINIFNTAPGFAKYNGYLPSIADPFGRQVYARIAARF
ncbi:MULTISPECIES: TonB-dependent siderophore receptor [unclassified Novosphingobium]|uniref:TonB-dependent receptor plug domain-containing protein n=1 Tax=unclassified Novosphingobium TaxID=2644732 RepID=UPI0014946497|nr:MULTISPECIES: TonB-dependent receptor [unclassified Novosphingobium]MBB3357418.1 iron complex outermembrane receptor protein [Novosphingobium sp. BK256]MBB3373920.1 iron complex outermembrane receptor protein [Novosphingobium sp. BK280]MBB3378332.1 iron complex outermembrane receptor protein [Novosphingobium sp. BK258]MBB3419884.1 iron complex outermembrane receptor protein [Novosphingobium sp. BK267]MBB3447795.1 iron complex outermembrane receptor protein [Novosphingobium sp. BK352]